MTFNDGAKSGGSRVSKRGRTAGIAVGGGGIGLVAIFLIAQLFGVNLSGLVDPGAGLSDSGAASDTVLENCDTGADANADVTCAMDFAAQSIETFWVGKLGSAYREPGFVIFEGSTSTGCGGATSAIGPFYCPADETVYLDVVFFDELRNRFGASGGPLAQMYVLAHEWGHHISNLSGAMAQAQDGKTGATSNSVRLELQADCYAGAWAGEASSVPDASGTPFLKPITREQIADALNAASVIGDDRIQEKAGGQVDPHTWSHGSSEQRQRWFSTGFERGVGSCDTFSVSGADL